MARSWSSPIKPCGLRDACPGQQDQTPPGHPIRLEAARGEWEGFQVGVELETGQSELRLELTDLAGPGGFTIPATTVAVFREAWVKIDTPSPCQGLIDFDCKANPAYDRLAGFYPDPLVPILGERAVTPDGPGMRARLPAATPFGPGAVLWLELQVPPEAPAGKYAATLRLAAEASSIGRPRACPSVSPVFAVELTVWDFALPAERHVATSYIFDRKALWRYHGGPKGPDAKTRERIERAYEVEIHRHRLDFTNHPAPLAFSKGPDGRLLPPDFGAWDAVMAPRLDGSYYPDGAGIRRFNVPFFAPGHGRAGLDGKTWAEAAALFAQHLGERGWLERAYLYAADEPWLPGHSGYAARIAADTALLGQRTKGWQGHVLVTGPWLEILNTSTDIWCPVTAMYDDSYWPKGMWPGKEKYAELKKAGKELWFYVCNANFPPTMGYDLDSPVGWEPRLLHWGAWREGASGFLYWHLNWWQSPEPWQKLANPELFGELYARNGDGILVYPGNHDGTEVGHGSPPDVAIDGPVVSLRLKQIRDGIEDWEMLLLLERLGGRGFAEKQVATVYRSFGVPPDQLDPRDPPWTLDPEALLAARGQIARKIEHLLHPDLHTDPEGPGVLADAGAGGAGDSEPDADGGGAGANPAAAGQADNEGCAAGPLGSRAGLALLGMLALSVGWGRRLRLSRRDRCGTGAGQDRRYREGHARPQPRENA
jgi:hypothetical protein